MHRGQTVEIVKAKTNPGPEKGLLRHDSTQDDLNNRDEEDSKIQEDLVEKISEEYVEDYDHLQSDFHIEAEVDQIGSRP
jgi:hypothetical protein